MTVASPKQFCHGCLGTKHFFFFFFFFLNRATGIRASFIHFRCQTNLCAVQPVHVARKVLRGLRKNRVCFWQGTERPLIVSVLNLLCRNASFSINTADGKGQTVAPCLARMQPPFHPSLVGMQMWELQNNDTLWTSLCYSTWTLHWGNFWWGGSWIVVLGSPPHHPSWGLRCVLLFFSKGQGSWRV